MTDIRSKWPAAQHVQEAADHLRRADPNLADYQQGYFAVVAERLDAAANEMAWLAPFREHEGGYRPWRDATRMAHGLLGLPDADNCPVCHTRVRPEREAGLDSSWISGDDLAAKEEAERKRRRQHHGRVMQYLNRETP